MLSIYIVLIEPRNFVYSVTMGVRAPLILSLKVVICWLIAILTSACFFKVFNYFRVKTKTLDNLDHKRDPN